MKRLQIIKLFTFAFILLLSTTSCTKDEMDGNSPLSGVSVSLKSTTSDLSPVYIEIEDVQLKVKEDGNLPNAWVSLNAINNGAQNISNFRGDAELVLVNHFEIKSTFIHEIRLVLGDNNFIDINQTLLSLDTADIGNAKPSNLVKLELAPNHIYEIVINLNIDESIWFDDHKNMMVLDPKLYTEIRKF